MTKRSAYQAYSTYLIRLPSMSLAALDRLPADEKGLGDFVKTTWINNSFLRQAIMLASTDLATALQRYADGMDAPCSEQVYQSFLNYFTRMSTRPTPFGLFAGVATGTITDNQGINIRLSPPEESSVHFRPDMAYLNTMIQHTIAHSELSRHARYYASSSIYWIGNELRYTTTVFNQEGKRSYQLVTVEGHRVLFGLLEYAKSTRTYCDLVDHIIRSGYDTDEAEDFVNELIASGLLINYLAPVLTGIEYHDFLHQTIQSDRLDQFFPVFCKQYALFSSMTNPADYPELMRNFSQLADDSGLVYDKTKVIQADLLRKTDDNRLSAQLSGQILLGIRILRYLTKFPETDPLSEFKKHFLRRFGENDVPLPLVLDQEYGVGLNGPVSQQQSDPSDLLDDLARFGSPGRKRGRSAGNPVEGLTASVDPADDFIEIDAACFRKMNVHDGSWPEQLFALVSLSGNEDRYEVCFNFAGEGNATYLMNRFGFLPDDRIGHWMDQMLLDQRTSRPELMFAEVVHLPESRTGNILQRKSTFLHEIPFMAQSTLSADRRIGLNDMLVRVADDRVILLHAGSGKEIIPTLSNAHNYKMSQLPIYEFLVTCGKQGRDRSFNLDQLERPKMGKVPGVKYKNMLLRLPRWYLPAHDLWDRIGSADNLAAIAVWANDHHLPQKVFLKQGDRHLYIDWRNSNLVRSFYDFAKSLTHFVFEPFRYANGSPVTDRNGSYANEMLLCFRKKN